MSRVQILSSLPILRMITNEKLIENDYETMK
jgi:hypothetical protein